MKLKVTTTYRYSNGDTSKCELVVRGKKQAADTKSYFEGWVRAHKRTVIGTTITEAD